MKDRPKAKLVLFDIDGTLLHTGGAGRRAIRQSLQEIFGSTGPVKNFPFCGKTDPQIILELMTLAGYAASYIEKRMARFWDTYVDHLRVEMAQNDRLMIYPGVVQLVKQLHEHDGTLLGLQTGNIERGARLKLEPVSLNQYFPVGAFGDDSTDRDHLPRIAVKRIKEHFGKEFRAEDVIIIGDTPADISCARHFGGKAVVVATGFVSREELEQAEPDALFEDFSEYEKVVEEVLR